MRPDRAVLQRRLPDSVPAYLRKCVTVDTRSLAVFRMLVAVLIVGDLLSRSRNFWFYYTDDGAVSQGLAELYTSSHAVSVFFYTQDARLIAALFALHGIIAVILFFGYKSRLMLIMSFYFVISLDHHNPLVLSYSDTLFRMLLFWAIFLPLGERWSIDAIQRKREPRDAVSNLASAAIMIQMVFMYSVNAQNKWPSELWHSGEAAILVMGIDEMTFLLGDTMRNFPALLQIGGRTWFYLLLTTPLLILLYGRLRYPHLLGLFGGHTAFVVTVRIGAFPYVAMLGLITFLQPRFWADGRRVLVFLGIGWLPDVLVPEATRFGRFLADRLPGRLIEFPGRDAIIRRTVSVFVAISLLGLIVWPAFAFAAEGPYMEESPLPEDTPLGEIPDEWGVPQPQWSIFAGPGPRQVDRYYVFPAETTDGQVFDLYNQRPMTYDRPGQQLQRQHDAYRKRFYMNSIRRADDGFPIINEFGDHLCERWEEELGVELAYINMYVVQEQITIETIDDPDNRSSWIEQIAFHSCGKDAPREIAPPEDFEDDG